MDQDLKRYADAVYESARLESGRTFRQERADAAQKGALRNSNLPLSGFDMQVLCGIATHHIERCMTARLESYQEAYTQTSSQPSEQDLTDIIEDCKAVQIQEINHAVGAIKAVINTRGVPFLPDMASLEQQSGHAHDRVLDKWKVWRAKVQLKSSPPNPEERKKHLDALVPVYNRAELDLDLISTTSKSSQAQPCSLLFLDLDKFKSINDALGHSTGDHALKLFASELQQVCRGKGTVYRNGGDEFCIILPNHSLHESAAIAERICRHVRSINNERLPRGLSTSIGVACFPESTTSASELMSQADNAMYTAKRAGGDQVSLASGPIETQAKPKKITIDPVLLADLISELEDNLDRAKAPRLGDYFTRPSNQIWKNYRNRIALPDPVRLDVTNIYREIDSWLTVVESGANPLLGSPVIEGIAPSLRTRLPGVIEELRKLL